MPERNTYFKDEVIRERFNFKQLFRVMIYVIPFKKVFITILFLMLFAVGLSLIPPLLLKDIVDRVAETKDYKDLMFIIGGFLIVGAADITITFFHQRMSGRTGHKIIANIRRDIFTKLQELPFDFFDNRPAGKIVIRVTSYINSLADFFANTLLNFIVNILRIVIVAAFMFALNAKLTLVVLASLIPLAIIIFIIRAVLRKLYRAQRSKDSNRTAFIVESIMGINVLKSFNRTEINKNIYGVVQGESCDNWKSIVKINELNTPVVEMFWTMGILLIYSVSVGLIASGNIMVGTVIAFFSYMSMFNGPLTQMAMIMQQMAQVSSNLERIFETMDTPITIKDSDNAVDISDVKGNIDFKNITFSYDKEINILENFTLSIKQGQKVALVGPTGAGKTTIINLITRFYDPQQGVVMLDGQDIKDFTMHSLRLNVGVLIQDNFIFKGTIMDNIRYGKIGATDNECINAAERIRASDFINKLPNGYYTELAEKGDGLSSGEKQLLSFARMALKNPAVVILDEATSSIDSETEEIVQEALNIILEGKTAIIVAHRLSTIKKCDNIIYIANKGIIEQGTHEQLMGNNGPYYYLNINH